MICIKVGYIYIISIMFLLLIPSINAKPVQSWDNSCRIPEDWYDYIYNEWMPEFRETWGGSRGDGKDYDLNHDKTLNVLDILYLRSFYGTERGSKEYKGYLDLNHDGTIGHEDTELLMLNWEPWWYGNYKGWADLNKDGYINILDFGRLNYILWMGTVCEK